MKIKDLSKALILHDQLKEIEEVENKLEAIRNRIPCPTLGAYDELKIKVIISVNGSRRTINVDGGLLLELVSFLEAKFTEKTEDVKAQVEEL